MAEPGQAPFDAIGERYEAAFTDRAAELAATEWLIGGVAPGARVLDLGCGTGLPVAKRLAEAGLAVTGIDESEVMLALARERVPGATFVRADMRSIGPEFGEFEGVTAFFSLLMLAKADIEAVLRAVRDRLRGAGLLAVAMVAGDFDGAPLEFLDVPVRLSAYPTDELAKLLASTGFDVVDVQEVASVVGADQTETQIYLRARVKN
jgi:predicted TPR repeat methyltransferase